jgi:acyl dehydratase
MQRLYLEDITVGAEFLSGEHAMDADQITTFAKQYDPQPFHTDPEAAQHSFFQGLAASGWHTAAVSMKLVIQSVPFSHGIIGAGGEIGWPRPTRPTDILHVKTTVAEIKPSRSKPDRAIVVVKCQTLNQDGDVLQNLTANLLAFRRDA